MTVENIPWMIEGGLHSAASGRRVLYKATGGAEGVAGIGDLRVHQAAIANGTVLVEPGGAVMVSRYPNVKGQSYDGQVTAQHVVNVAANGGGSTRYDLVIARIDDWNYAGQQAKPAVLPTDTVPAFKLTTIQGVPSTTKTAKERNLGYPAIALARIAMPAGTSAVTDAMITPLREVAVPRRQRALLTRALTTGSTDVLTAKTAAGESWPNELWMQEIPEWASRARIVANWGGVRFPANSNAFGNVWVTLGWNDPAVVSTQTVRYDAPAVGNVTRQSLSAADDIAIPAGLRGKAVYMGVWGNVDPSQATAGPSLDGGSSVVLDIEFLEAPAEDA
jgi:hypothetical protein